MRRSMKGPTHKGDCSVLTLSTYHGDSDVRLHSGCDSILTLTPSAATVSNRVSSLDSAAALIPD